MSVLGWFDWFFSSPWAVLPCLFACLVSGGQTLWDVPCWVLDFLCSCEFSWTLFRHAVKYLEIVQFFHILLLRSGSWVWSSAQFRANNSPLLRWGFLNAPPATPWIMRFLSLAGRHRFYSQSCWSAGNLLPILIDGSSPGCKQCPHMHPLTAVRVLRGPLCRSAGLSLPALSSGALPCEPGLPWSPWTPREFSGFCEATLLAWKLPRQQAGQS